MGFFVFMVVLFHIGLVYWYRFRFLKFLIVVEMSLIVVFFCMNLMVAKCEITFLLLFLSIIACEAALGLSLLVRWVRWEDKYNVKSSLFVGF